MGRAKTNKKRKNRKKSPTDTLARLKSISITALFGALASFGLWRCLGEDSGAVLKPYHTGRATRVIDVGQGKKPDPTIVHEQQLLSDERPEPASEELAAQSLPPDTPRETEEELPKNQPDNTPPPDPFPKYAVAFHFHTQVFGAPDKQSRAVAYARRGATFRVSERVSRKDCPKGWYEIKPGNLFACNGEGILVGDLPQTFAPSPPAADLESPMPYSYSYVTDNNTPQYWRIPTPSERKVVTEMFKSSDNQADAGAEDPDGGDGLPPYVYQEMQRGYYVSIDTRPALENAALYQSTVRGRYLPAGTLAPAKPSSFSGVLLGRSRALPAVYVVGSGVSLLIQNEETGLLKKHSRIARFETLPFLGEMERRNRKYVQVGERQFLPSRVAAVMRQSQPPENLRPGERWIDVNLGEQTLIAYEGEKPVFATLVSTGRDDFPTPEGIFRIYSKHVAITMDDTAAGEEAYSIEDVPWTQYFKDSYAIHAAFWHNRFGRQKSHGCINLSPKDAHRLFFWTGPHLSTGLHGVSSTRGNPGTRISIHK